METDFCAADRRRGGGGGCVVFVFFQWMTMPADKDVILRIIAVGRQWPRMLTSPFAVAALSCAGPPRILPAELVHLSFIWNLNRASHRACLRQHTARPEMWHVRNCGEKIQFCLSYLTRGVGWGTSEWCESEKRKKSRVSSYHGSHSFYPLTNILVEEDNKLITIRSGLGEGLLCNPSTNTRIMNLPEYTASVLMIINASNVLHLGSHIVPASSHAVVRWRLKACLSCPGCCAQGPVFLIKSCRISLSNIGRCDHCLSLRLNTNMFIFGPRFI